MKKSVKRNVMSFIYGFMGIAACFAFLAGCSIIETQDDYVKGLGCCILGLVIGYVTNKLYELHSH